MDKKLKLMIMDDEESIVHYITKLFEIKGFETFGAANSTQALEIFENEQPDICILDILLVDSTMDGIEVLEEIRRKSKETVCIMFTRISEDEKINKANELGAFEFLLKPIDASKLKEVVAAAVEQIEKDKA